MARAIEQLELDVTGPTPLEQLGETESFANFFLQLLIRAGWVIDLPRRGLGGYWITTGRKRDDLVRAHGASLGELAIELFKEAGAIEASNRGHCQW